MPVLARAGAARVLACEWNPDAVAALRHNLATNRAASAASPSKKRRDKNGADGGGDGARRGVDGHDGPAVTAAERCVVYPGDNRSAATRDAVRGVADRVLLGLLPSSEDGWPLAAAALRGDTGGWLHVHENVRADEPSRRALTARAEAAFRSLLAEAHAARGEDAGRGASARGGEETPREWSVVCHHVERVKSYAPRVDHVVLDIECRPPGAAAEHAG